MKAVYKHLLDKSLGAALAAIEVYNKPDFKYREESFAILLVNSWELLLKAKILKDSNNKLSSLYVHQGRKVKKSRTGNPLTVELLGAMQKITTLDATIIDNLTSFIEIRDTAVHFYNDDTVRYIVYTLGVAALKNYQTLVKQWFKKSLAAYHFYILPIGFSHSFKTFRMLDLEASPPSVANLIKAVAETQERTQEGGEFFFACEIAAELKSAKKFAASPDLTVKIDQGAKAAAVVITQIKRKLDQYPLSFTEVVQKVKKDLPSVKSNVICEVMKNNHLKQNEAFSAYSFRTKAHEDSYLRTGRLPSGTASIYNEDAVRFLVQKLQEEAGRPPTVATTSAASASSKT